MRRAFFFVALNALVVSGCCCTGMPTAPAAMPMQRAVQAVEYPVPPGVAEPDTSTVVEMRNVHFRVDRRLALEIRHLNGTMQPQDGFAVIDFGNASSFYIRLAHAEIHLTMDNLTYLLQNYVFAYDGAPIRIHSMEAEGKEIVQTGTLHKVVDIPFEMRAEVEATPEGYIRLRPTAMRICNIPGQGLMQALGIQLDEMLDLSGAPGVSVEGNDLVMDPQQLLPPPAIRGQVKSVFVENGRLVQVFGSPDAAPDIPEPSFADAENYMFYSGGTLQFGKLYMVESDLQIVDEDPSDPFDFYLREYLQQLVAGRSQTLPDKGLAAFFPDYEDIEPTP